MKVRIQKLLADAGVESRRHVEEMVLARRISVNGVLVTHLPVMVDPAEDTITIDGEPIEIKPPEDVKKIYVIMHKPKGVYCTNVAQGEQRRAIDLLPPEIDKRLYPVGRLDADSRGLLLLTNDGDLTQKLTHPKYGVSKTYTAVVDGYVRPETVEQLSEGIWLADPEKGGFKTGRSFIKVVKRGNMNSVLQITIREGRNRQLRRMLANVGHKIRELTRVKIGPLELGKLKSGGSRVLHEWEVDKLREAIKPKDRPAPFATGAAGRKAAAANKARESGKSTADGKPSFGSKSSTGKPAVGGKMSAARPTPKAKSPFAGEKSYDRKPRPKPTGRDGGPARTGRSGGRSGGRSSGGSR